MLTIVACRDIGGDIYTRFFRRKVATGRDVHASEGSGTKSVTGTHLSHGVKETAHALEGHIGGGVSTRAIHTRKHTAWCIAFRLTCAVS